MLSNTLKTILEKEVGQKVVWDDRFNVYAINLDSKEEAERIRNLEGVKKDFETEIVDFGGRCFLNFSPKENVLKYVLRYVLTKDDFKFGKDKVQVEFISANPTGQLHIGHGRGAFYGDVLVNILKMAGYSIEKEFYINNARASAQIKELGKTVLGKGESYLTPYLKTKITNYRYPISIVEAGFDVAKKIQEDNEKFIEEGLKIKFDNWFSEEDELYENSKIEKTLKLLEKKDLVYEKDGAVWLKTSKFGDEDDRVVVRSDGLFSYFLADIAYHINKFEKRNFDKVINIWGADHQGHVKRMMATKKMLGWEGDLDILVSQLVTIKEGGEIKKLSKRKGNVILLEDLLEEVGIDALRWFFLEKSLNTHMDFDLDLAKEQSKKNPVYYVQYAGARMWSILEKANLSGKKLNSFSIGLAVGSFSKNKIKAREKEFEFLGTHEKNLILKLARFPEIIEDISKDYQVHHLTTYIYELAKTSTNFYENVRVLEEKDKERKEALMELVVITRQVLENGLRLLGVSAPKKM